MSNNNLSPLDINLEKDKKITKWSDKTFDKIWENIKEKTGDILEHNMELKWNWITESDKKIINDIKFNNSIELAQKLVKALTFEEEYITIEIEDLKLKIDRKPIYECLYSQFLDRNEIYIKNIEISMLRNKKSDEEIKKQIELIKSKRLLTKSDFDKIKKFIWDERLISKLFNLNLYNESISRFSLLDTKGIWLLDDEIANIRKNPDLVRKNFDKLQEKPYNIWAQIEDKFVILNDDNDYYLKALVHLVSDVK